MIEIGERQALELREGLFAQLIGHLHRDARHDPSLDRGEGHRREVQSDEEQEDLSDCGKFDARTAVRDHPHDAFVNLCRRLTENFRPDDIEDRRGDRKDHDEHDGRRMGLQIGEKLSETSLEILRLVSGHHAPRSRTVLRTFGLIVFGYFIRHFQAPLPKAGRERSPGRFHSFSAARRGFPGRRRGLRPARRSDPRS